MEASVEGWVFLTDKTQHERTEHELNLFRSERVSY